MILIVSKIQISNRKWHIRCSDLFAYYEICNKRVHKKETVNNERRADMSLEQKNRVRTIQEPRALVKNSESTTTKEKYMNKLEGKIALITGGTGDGTMANTYVDVVTKRVDVNGTSFVYREAGEKNGIPIVLLHPLTAVLDDWDPRTIDSLAQKHRVIAFNNRGVGGSKGTTPDTVDDMATDAVAFIRALGLSKTDLLGFSLGGFIAQVIAQKHPDLVRRMILAGTSAAGGDGISNVGSVLQNAVARATAEKKHPKQ